MVTNRRRLRIGAHVPTRGGLLGAVESARACGAEAAQIWGSNPRAWAPPRVDDDRCERFRRAWSEARIGPLFLHAPYMVNVASPNAQFRRRSVDLASATVALADRIAADGVVVHAGAGGAGTERGRALEAAAESLSRVAALAETTTVLVELMAGGAGAVASRFPEAGELFDAAGYPSRLALCIDTCHLFAAGYDLSSGNGVSTCFEELSSARLVGRLRLVHTNDSRFRRGERRDSHQHIGRGHIGLQGFHRLER